MDKKDADVNVPASQASTSNSYGRGVWALILISVCITGGLLAKSRLAQYSDPANYDPSPIPRPTKNAPFITTPDLIVSHMIKMGEITEQDMVYDLGCGDGRLVITAAVQTGCRGVGIDIDPKRVTEANENVKLHDVEKLVTIQEQDVFKVDLREADVVLMYLLPQMLRDLKPQFDQCRPGTRLVSHDFEIENVKPDKSERINDETDHGHTVYLYTTPLKRLPPKVQPKYKLE